MLPRTESARNFLDYNLTYNRHIEFRVQPAEASSRPIIISWGIYLFLPETAAQRNKSVKKGSEFFRWLHNEKKIKVN